MKDTNVHKLRRNRRLKTKFDKFKLAFIPFNVIRNVIIISIILIIISFVLIQVEFLGTIGYDIFISIASGSVATILITFATELTNNYNGNMLSLRELNEYYSSIYYFYNQIEFDKKYKNEFDEVKEIWIKINEIKSILEKTINNKSEYLSDEEESLINRILQSYREIRFSLYEIFKENTIDPRKDYTYKYPNVEYSKFIVDTFSKDILNCLEADEADKQIYSIVDDMLESHFMLLHCMLTMNISNQAIIGDLNNGKIEGDDLDEHIGYTKKMNASIISMHCRDIYKSMMKLVDCAKQKPYYDFLISEIPEKLSSVKKGNYD